MPDKYSNNQASEAIGLVPRFTWGDLNQVFIEQFTEVSFDAEEVSYPSHSLFFYFTGIVDLQTEQISSRHLLPQQGVLHAANERHSAKSLKPTSFLAIHISPRYLQSVGSIVKTVAALDFRSTVIEGDNYLSAIMGLVDKEMSVQDLHSDLALNSLIAYICVHLARNYSDVQPFGESTLDRLDLCQIKQALEYIEMYLMTDIQLTELAAQAQMSVYRFLNAFKELTGQTPHQYIIRRRLDVAKYLLRKPQLSLEEIARQTGFANQSHFTKMFRKHLGSTPHAFRKL